MLSTASSHAVSSKSSPGFLIFNAVDFVLPSRFWLPSDLGFQILTIEFAIEFEFEFELDFELDFEVMMIELDMS